MFHLAPANEGQLLLKSFCKGFDGTLEPSIRTKVPVFSVSVNYPWHCFGYMSCKFYALYAHQFLSSTNTYGTRETNLQVPLSSWGWQWSLDRREDPRRKQHTTVTTFVKIFIFILLRFSFLILLRFFFVKINFVKIFFFCWLRNAEFLTLYVTQLQSKTWCKKIS